MDNDTTATASRTPIHLWIVGGLALLWNAFGAIDYVKSRSHDQAWTRRMMPDFDPATVFAYMDSMPIYASIGWALGVWGGLAGSILLLMRSRYAVSAFVVSLVGMIVSFGDQLLIHPAPAGMNNPMIPLFITALGIGLFVYARAMRMKNILA